MSRIHPSSVISPQAEIAPDVEIGPFCIVRGKVKIGSATKLESHVSVGSDTGVVEIGKNNQIAYGAALGGPPQDIHYKGEPTKLVIGDNNMIREFTTLNIGTVKGGGATRVGNHNLIMAYVHLGHDVQMGNHNVVVNSTQIAGHVRIDDHATISGVCAFNQFTKVGSYSFTAGYSSVNKDILPYSVARGNYAVATATNKVALERAGFSDELIDTIHQAVRILLKGSSTTTEGIDRILKECKSCPEIDYLVNFVRDSKRGLAK